MNDISQGTTQTLVQTPTDVSYLDDEWHHIVGTNDSYTGAIYVDGDLKVTGNQP